MAEAYLAACYNRPGVEIVDHFTYAIVSDGDLMEGVSSEAASLAGHLKLGKLIYLYDDNHVTLSAGTDISPLPRTARTASRRMAGTSSRSQTATTSKAIDRALRDGPRRNRTAVADSGAHAHRLWFALTNRTLSNRTDRRWAEEVRLTKQKSWLADRAAILYPREGSRTFSQASSGESDRGGVERPMFSVRPNVSRSGQRFSTVMRGDLPDGWDRDIPVFPADAKGMATRVAAGKVMNAVASRLPALIGGSADSESIDPYCTFRIGRF